MKNSEFSILAFVCLVVRAGFFGAGIGDALALAAIAALIGWELYIASKKPIALNDKVTADIDHLNGELQKLKDAVSAVRVQSTFRR